MNAQAKVEADNLALWHAVEKTDPRHTKKVNQRGGFTAISAHYQVMRATEQFGPVGIGWGYVNGEPIWHESLVIVPVTIWHGDRETTFGPVFGGAEWKNGNRLDSDAPKKAATDGLTKALSHLGFNADVFLGRFDDNKYVEQVRQEFDEGQSRDGEVSPITPAQLTKLMNLIESTGLGTNNFIHKYQITGVDKLPASRFDEAVEAINDWLAEKIKAETAKKAKANA